MITIMNVVMGFIGLTIDFAGFDGVTSVAQTTEPMLTRLVWVYGPGLMCITLLGAWIFSRYHLDQERCEDIQTELVLARS